MHDPNKLTCRNRNCGQPRPGYTQTAAAQQYAKHLAAPDAYGIHPSMTKQQYPQNTSWNTSDITDKYKDARPTQLASMIATASHEYEPDEELWEDERDPFELFEEAEQDDTEADENWDAQYHERRRLKRLK